MSQNIEPPGGLPFREAFAEFTDPDKYQAWEDADVAWLELRPPPKRSRAKSLSGMLDKERDELGPPLVVSKSKPDKRELQKAKQRRDRAFAVAWDDFTKPLRSGEVVAFGFPGAMSAKKARSRITADLWGVMRIKSKPTSTRKPVFEGGSNDYYDVRFHRASELAQWGRGAPLALAWRAHMPLHYANYQAFWAEEGGSYDRWEFLETLREAALAGDCELRYLPHDYLSAKWTPITRDFLEAWPTPLEIDEKKSTVTLPNGKVYALSVFLRDDADRSHSLVNAEDETRPRYVGNLRQKVDQVCEELKRRSIDIGTRTVYDELRASGEDPNRETVRRYVSDYMKNFERS